MCSSHAVCLICSVCAGRPVRVCCFVCTLFSVVGALHMCVCVCCVFVGRACLCVSLLAFLTCPFANACLFAPFGCVFDLLVCCVWFVRVACSVCLVCGVFVWFVCMSGWYVLPVLVC